MNSIDSITCQSTEFSSSKPVIYGQLELSNRTLYIQVFPKNQKTTQLRWEKDDPEPFVMVSVYNKESQNECPRYHNKPCSSFGYHGTWQDGYDKLPEYTFPHWLPLRIFIKKDGSLKDTGAKINLLYKKQPIVLTCVHKKDFLDGKSFQDGLIRRVQLSYSLNKLQSEEVEKAVKLAQDNKDCISSD